VRDLRAAIRNGSHRGLLYAGTSNTTWLRDAPCSVAQAIDQQRKGEVAMTFRTGDRMQYSSVSSVTMCSDVHKSAATQPGGAV
jgi:hypothetical protein